MNSEIIQLLKLMQTPSGELHLSKEQTERLIRWIEIQQNYIEQMKKLITGFVPKGGKS